MLSRRSFFAFLALTVLAVPGIGQDKTATTDVANLKWRFEKDKKFYQKLTTDTTQDMKVMGQDVKQKQKQTFVFSWTPLEEKDKNWIIKQKIEAVMMEITIGGNTISYDSTNPNQPNNPLQDFFKALVGSEFTLTLGPDMKVTKVEGRKEFLDKLIAANQTMKPLLEQILSEDALKQMADPSFSALPGKEVKKDETWKVPTKLNLGPIGSYETTYEYKYVGKDEKNKELDKITETATLKYIPPTNVDVAGQGGLPFKIKSANLEGKNATGTILYDPKKGRVVNAELNLTLGGKLDIDIGGQVTTVELNQVQKTTIDTTDDNPITPPKKQ